MKSIIKHSAAMLALVVAVGCGNAKVPAETALNTATTSYAAVKADAEKYVPDQAKGVQTVITSAQAALAKGDYAAVIEQTKDVPAKVTALSTAIAAKKTELAASWTAMSTSLPSLVGALKSRVEMLSKSKGVPAGLTKDIVEQAKSGFAAVSQEWTAAVDAAKAGDISTAVAKGSEVKTKVIGIMTSLKMQIPKGAM
jgi:hypothetical protein